jgi:hypothetical protein
MSDQKYKTFGTMKELRAVKRAVENPPTQLPSEDTQLPEPDIQVPELAPQIPVYQAPQIPREERYPDTRIPKEAHYPSRQNRTQTSLRLPSNKLKFYKVWCLQQGMDFQDAVEQALDYWIPIYQATQQSQIPGYPNPQVPRNPGIQQPGALIEHDFHDDDDSIKNDNHLHQVRGLYTQLSGKKWTKRDDDDYRKVSILPLETILPIMRTVHQRAGAPIGSFAFFVTSIQKELAGGGEQGRAALRKKYEKFVGEIRGLHVGDGNYRVSDLIHDLKTRCVRDGVSWDDDIANEVCGV